MGTAGGVITLVGVFTFLAAQIWLILIIMRESPFAALLCLLIPFLPFFFIRDHWSEAKPAVLTSGLGVLVCLVGGILMNSSTPG